MKMKKALSIILTAAIILSLTACTYVEPPENDPGNTNTMYHGFMDSIMKGDNGYYYIGSYEKNGTVVAREVPLFYDMKTGSSVILCGKPECMHDGNEFCVATARERWTVCFKECYSLYNGYIYRIYDCMLTSKEGYTGKNEIRVKRFDLRGNECSNLGCIMECITEGDEQMAEVSNLIFHRGRLYFAMSNCDEGDLFWFDLETGEKKQIVIPKNEEGGRMSNPSGLVAEGDYFYYAIRYTKYWPNSHKTENDVIYDKTVLRRYNILTEETETISALPDIYSSFTVNDGIVYYTTVDRVENTFSLYSYNISEDKTTTIADKLQQNFMDKKHLNGSARVITDRKYLYISTGYHSNGDKDSPEYENDFYIYSLDGEQLLHGLDNLPADIPKWSYQYKVLDGEIYMDFNGSSKQNDDTSDTISGVYMIKTEDLINGSSDWTRLYKA